MLITANVCIAQEEQRRDSTWSFENDTKNKILNFSFLTNIPPGQLAGICIDLYKGNDYKYNNFVQHANIFPRLPEKTKENYTSYELKYDTISEGVYRVNVIDAILTSFLQNMTDCLDFYVESYDGICNPDFRYKIRFEDSSTSSADIDNEADKTVCRYFYLSGLECKDVVYGIPLICNVYNTDGVIVEKKRY